MQVDMKRDSELIVCQDRHELADKAACLFAEIVQGAIEKYSLCNVALSGGSTPKLLYERLCRPELSCRINWDKIVFYVSDERCVAPQHEESNFGNAERHLLDPLKIKDSARHPFVGTESNPDKSAHDYENEIRRAVRCGADGLPEFDIIFLGMGPDGHTASLFPGTDALNETKKLVARNYVDKLKADRLTFTLPLINNAARVIFLVAGEDKSEVLRQVLSDTGNFPSRKICPCPGRLIWIVDKAAAGRLSV